MAERAKARGYSVLGVSVETEAVEIDMERVNARVRNGRHDTSEGRSAAQVSPYARKDGTASTALLFNKSTEQGHRLVAVGPPTRLYWFEPVPGWAKSFPTVPADDRLA